MYQHRRILEICHVTYINLAAGNIVAVISASCVWLCVASEMASEINLGQLSNGQWLKASVNENVAEVKYDM